MSWGFVYVLANASMPGIVKIGRTDRSPRQRAEELSGGTGVPTPFHVELYAEVNDPVAVEQWMHEAYDDVRIASNREFFRAEPHQLYEALSEFMVSGWCLPHVREAYEKMVEARRGPF